VALTTNPPSSAEVKERIELYLYSPYGPSWPVTRLILLVTLIIAIYMNNSVTLLLLSNFSLLSFDWEIFTYPGMQSSTGLGSAVLFVV